MFGVFFLFVQNLKKRTNVHDFICTYSHKMHDFMGRILSVGKCSVTCITKCHFFFKNCLGHTCYNMVNITHEIGQVYYWSPPKFHRELSIVSEETCFCNAVPHKQCRSSSDLLSNMFVWSSWMMRMFKHVQNAFNIPYGTKSATFFLAPWTRKCMIWQWSHCSYAKIYLSVCA